MQDDGMEGSENTLHGNAAAEETKTEVVLGKHLGGCVLRPAPAGRRMSPSQGSDAPTLTARVRGLELNAGLNCPESLCVSLVSHRPAQSVISWIK